MSRKTVALAVTAFCALFVFTSVTFAEESDGRCGRREALRERLQGDGAGQLGERFDNLPEWKKEAIRKVLAWRREQIQKVRANEALTREEKLKRIRHIVQVSREKIRKILRAGHHRRGGGTDAPDVDVEE